MEPRSMEIGNVARDKITSFEMSYGLSANYPKRLTGQVLFLTRWKLEKVIWQNWGWDVWAGRISYSAHRYQTGHKKQAIANNINAKEFKLISDKGIVFN